MDTERGDEGLMGTLRPDPGSGWPPHLLENPEGFALTLQRRQCFDVGSVSWWGSAVQTHFIIDHR